MKWDVRTPSRAVRVLPTAGQPAAERVPLGNLGPVYLLISESLAQGFFRI